MRVVVTSFGSAGDFNPLLAIAAALVRRGADTTFVANPFYEGRVRKAGCRFVGAGERFDVFAALEANPRYFHPRSGITAIWRDLVVPSVREIFPVVRQTARELGAATVVSHVLSYGGAWAAAETGAQSVVVTTSSSAWLSRHHPFVFTNWRPPRSLYGLLLPAIRGIARLVGNRVLTPLASEIGAPPIADIVREADLNVGVWPEWFRSPAPDDPPRSRLCGFVFDDAGSDPRLPEGLEGFLADDDPPVVAAFGSAASLHGSPRYEAIAQACEQIGRRCVLVGASALGTASTATAYRVEAAAYSTLFPRAAAIVHHGGFGTCAEALRAGRRSLVTPVGFDQFDVAARVEDGGYGRWAKRIAENPRQLAQALDALLSDDTCRTVATRAAEKIAAAPDGAERAADLILGL